MNLLLICVISVFRLFNVKQYTTVINLSGLVNIYQPQLLIAPRTLKLWYHYLFLVDKFNYGTILSNRDTCTQSHQAPCSEELDSKGQVHFKKTSDSDWLLWSPTVLQQGTKHHQEQCSIGQQLQAYCFVFNKIFNFTHRVDVQKLNTRRGEELNIIYQ